MGPNSRFFDFFFDNEMSDNGLTGAGTRWNNKNDFRIIRRDEKRVLGFGSILHVSIGLIRRTFNS